MDFKTFDKRFVIEDVRAISGAKSGKAIKVDLDDGVDHWVALNQIDARSEVKAWKDHGRLIVSEWLAGQCGWLEKPPRKSRHEGGPDKGKQEHATPSHAAIDLYKKLKARIADRPDAVRDLETLVHALRGAA